MKASIFVRSFAAFLTLLLLSILPPALAGAAAFESTPSLKAALAKTAASDGGRLQAAINSRYGEFEALRKQETTLDKRIQEIHGANGTKLTLLRKRIGLIDADKVAKLEQELSRTKGRYEPLFNLYTAQNKQVSLARSFGDKTLVSVLRTQAEATKAAVQIARLDIHTKEAKLKAAKRERSDKMNRARKALSAVDPLGKQIKAQRSAASLHKKHAAAEWTNFTKAARKTDAGRAASALAALTDFQRRLLAQKTNILTLENQIAAIAAKVDGQVR
ncbi:hypothetical protein [Paenibacillus humicola]|uniref:hypothetical protein n=1 Tax=Paenibacillus humicola TaxID=3110540 RepID=UPI00237BB305|nr:hypothetical protein [Paenibacillus humicola]